MNESSPGATDRTAPASAAPTAGRGAGALTVAVLDPSAFTLPYDYALCDALAGAGVRVAFFTRDPRPGEPSPPRSFTTHAWFYRESERAMKRWPHLTGALRFGKGAEHGLGLARFSRWCDRERPDVVHFQWAALPILDRLLVRRLRGRSRIVFTVHDTKAFLGAASSRFQYRGWRSFLDDVDALIVHTEDGVRALREQGVRSPITVIPHGPLEFHGAPPGVVEEPEILLFGVLKPYKGADLLLDAFARVPPEIRRGWRVRIAGKVQMDPRPLEEQAKRLGIDSSVTWDLRYVGDAEIGTYFARASILAFPYRDIDTSGVLMGALGFRKAIVASRLGAFAELLCDRESALLVPREDVAGLAGALASLMESPDLRSRLGEASHHVFRAGVPSWETIARATVDLYAPPSRP